MGLFAWFLLLALALNYGVVVLVPFFRDGIYSMSDHDIYTSTSIYWTQSEIDAWSIWSCLGIPLLIGLSTEAILHWRLATALGRALRAALLLPAVILLVLSIVYFGTMSTWLLD